jgi:hypothetical protein
VVRRRHFARHRHVAAADQPRIRNGMVGRARWWIGVVSIASARVIAGRMVVSRRASIDVPAPGGPSKSPDYGHNACMAFTFAIVG